MAVRIERSSVVVVGGGSAAFESAVAAKQNGGARVTMLEKAPEPEFGGNARFSHTGFRFVYSGAEEIRGFMPDMEQTAFDRLQLPGYAPADSPPISCESPAGASTKVWPKCW